MAATETGTVRIGVVGVGRIGRMHASLLTHQVAGASVAMVHDAHQDTARGVAGELGVVAAGDVEELLTASDVDAVAICSSTETHADLIVGAARTGKAIFCEKPVSLDLAEVDRALDAVEEAGVRSRSASTAGSTRRMRPLPRRSRTAPWASRSSRGSRAATPRRRRWSTCAGRAGSSWT